MDARINDVDSDCALQYALYVLGQRHQELPLCRRDLHKGVKMSQAPLAAAHYKLKNAAMILMSQILREHGAEQVGFFDCFGGSEAFDRNEEALTGHRLWFRDLADWLHRFEVISQAASSVGNRGTDVAKFICDRLGVEYAGSRGTEQKG